MLYAIAAILLVGWLLGISVFHVTNFAIHVVLVLAVIALAMQLFRGRTAV